MLIIGKEYLSLYTSIQPHVYIHIDEEESGGEYGKNIMRPSSLSWSLASVLGPVLRASFFPVVLLTNVDRHLHNSGIDKNSFCALQLWGAHLFALGPR